MRVLLVTDDPSPSPLSLTAEDMALFGREAGREALRQAAEHGSSVFGKVGSELRWVRAEPPSGSPMLLTFRAFEKALTACGINVEAAALASDGLDSHEVSAFDVVLVDVNRTDSLYGRLGSDLRAIAARTPVLLLSRGVSAFGETVVKPVTAEALIARMRTSIHRFAEAGGRKGAAVA